MIKLTKFWPSVLDIIEFALIGRLLWWAGLGASLQPWSEGDQRPMGVALRCAATWLPACPWAGVPGRWACLPGSVSWAGERQACWLQLWQSCDKISLFHTSVGEKGWASRLLDARALGKQWRLHGLPTKRSYMEVPGKFPLLELVDSAT